MYGEVKEPLIEMDKVNQHCKLKVQPVNPDSLSTNHVIFIFLLLPFTWNTSSEF